ncbi:MAG: FAD:protein FMN transferase, partial [Oscillospiraceae bacterium]
MKKKIAFLCAIMIATLTSCSLTDKPYNTEIFVMSTYVTQQTYGKNNKIASENVNALLIDLENQLSLFIDGSDIDRINKNAGLSAVKVNSYTFELVKT